MAKGFKQKDTDGMVYSTNPDFLDTMHADLQADQELEPSKQNLRIWLDRFKGGKVATVIRGYQGNPSTLEQLGKQLKSVCGVGGSVKDGEVILQGDVRPKVTKELDKQGYKFKLAGG
jgi:translation initiation factor 1